ncbi:hypothetical protein OG252_42880 [Streptomyces sp. NBC_01352]|uniref:hypothetical protein n=1 Tax=unclassified Streptomyces TaxID=2593676 RepID=UPI0022507A04|nr:MULTISPECIES: hypothetical protein [unclassified Streptomyces]MCX4702684.1 hypothetical protein [Streptomyces sp. NBC_01373]
MLLRRPDAVGGGVQGATSNGGGLGGVLACAPSPCFGEEHAQVPVDGYVAQRLAVQPPRLVEQCAVRLEGRQPLVKALMDPLVVDRAWAPDP